VVAKYNQNVVHTLHSFKNNKFLGPPQTFIHPCGNIFENSSHSITLIFEQVAT